MIQGVDFNESQGSLTIWLPNKDFKMLFGVKQLVGYTPNTVTYIDVVSGFTYVWHDDGRLECKF